LLQYLVAIDMFVKTEVYYAKV